LDQPSVSVTTAVPSSFDSDSSIYVPSHERHWLRSVEPQPGKMK
jgi:mannose-6-phosphate isomerase-like protein (cupin superfamily)